MILATSSNPEFLTQVGMVGLFTRVIHVPRLNKIEQIIKVLQESDFTNQEVQKMTHLLQRSGYK
jgi:hypothetical protein